ncbi:Very short patch repair protein [Ruegeria atlantica]|uniref:Very short patch repair protein n=1 Tax=Ruegeria atlantica TaxID=81569 RepID=A0A0P1EBV9_9RHOB|nr:Very short patch repair protein [Ruegeria atlantica]
MFQIDPETCPIRYRFPRWGFLAAALLLEPKLRRNRARDLENERLLKDLGWRILVIWECAISGPKRLSPQDLSQKMSQWLHSDLPAHELGGDDCRAVGSRGG